MTYEDRLELFLGIYRCHHCLQGGETERGTKSRMELRSKLKL